MKIFVSIGCVLLVACTGDGTDLNDVGPSPMDASSDARLDVALQDAPFDSAGDALSTPDAALDSALLDSALDGSTDASADRPDGTAPGCTPRFFHDFEYPVTSVMDLTDHGWSAAKATNLTGSHRETLVTEDGALRFDLEGEGGQTDVYTELADIPADVTFEFDLFVDEDAGGIGRRLRFLYPSMGPTPNPSPPSGGFLVSPPTTSRLNM